MKWIKRNWNKDESSKVIVEDQMGNVIKPAKSSGNVKKKMFQGIAFLMMAGVAAGGTCYGVNQIAGNFFSTKSTASKTASGITAVNTSATGSSSEAAGVSAIVEKVMPSVVSITCQVTETANYGFGQTQTQEAESAGSGFILDQTDTQLMVATNYHVIEGASQITTGFSDDTTATAAVVGTDAENDLAVLAINLSDIGEDTLNTIQVATLGSSEDLSVGDTVIAIGNALGYGQSVTTGILSAKDREISAVDTSMTYLQTDAAINPGNSGGVLVNAAGEVIGINNAKIEDTSVEGMGYSIPMSTAQPILAQLETGQSNTESESGTYLGIYGTSISSEIASSYGIPEGVYVRQVESDSPAEAAGISAGDVVVGFEQTAITSMEELQAALKKKAAGDEVKITVQRANQNGVYEEKEVTVVLKEQTSTASDSTESGNAIPNENDSQNGTDSQNGSETIQETPNVDGMEDNAAGYFYGNGDTYSYYGY